MYLLKRYYIIGFILLAAFLLFVYAASAGPDSEVVVGTIGFFGIVALLPLFLYLVISEARCIEEYTPKEPVNQKEGEELMFAPKSNEQRYTKSQKTKTPGPTKRSKQKVAAGIDRDFIEGIRADQKGKEGVVEEGPEPKEVLLDIPNRADKASEPDHGEQLDDKRESKLLYIPEKIKEKPEPLDEDEKKLISGLGEDFVRTEIDGEKEQDKDKEPEDKSEDSQKKGDEKKNEEENQEDG